MKKIILALLLIVLPVTVFAAEAPTVTKLELSNSDGVISYKGDIEDPTTLGAWKAYAVMCKLYNSKDEEVDLLSTEVNEHKFEGSFTVTSNDTYTVSCANYEGGEIKSESIEVKDVKVSPKTGDNAVLYIVGALFALSLILIAVFCLKDNKEK